MGLKVRDPHRLDGCVFGQEACPVVSGTDCDRTGVVYKIECKQCKETAENVNSVHNYIGLTRSSLHSRMQSHLAGQRRQQSHNPLFRHDRDHHQGIPQEYETSIVATESKIVKLHCNEALRIEKQDPTYRINERNEGGRGGLVRITASRVAY